MHNNWNVNSSGGGSTIGSSISNMSAMIPVGALLYPDKFDELKKMTSGSGSICSQPLGGMPSLLPRRKKKSQGCSSMIRVSQLFKDDDYHRHGSQLSRAALHNHQYFYYHSGLKQQESSSDSESYDDGVKERELMRERKY